MVGLFGLINRLLPFATPGTPLIQDLLHLAALCTALYYAPQIQSYIQSELQKAQLINQEEQPGTQPDQHNDEPEGEHIQHEANRQRGPQAFVEDDLSGSSDSEDEHDDNLNDGGNAFFPEQRDAPPFGIPQPAGADNNNNDANANENLNQQARPRPLPGTNTSTRTVGAKKAKSLARKDQRRAYHEFMRSQGEAQRARDAEGAREREALLAEERARRAAAEAEVEGRRAREREEKREREARAQREEMARRESAVARVREAVRVGGVCDLAGVAREVGGAGADRAWVEGLVRASGLLGEKRSADGEGVAKMVLLTETGWVVEVAREDMEAAYAAVLAAGSADEQGRIPHAELGRVLEDAVRQRAVAAA